MRLFDAQLLKFIHRANHLRIVYRIAQAAQRDDGVHHDRDRSRPGRRLISKRSSIHRLGLLQRHASAADECAPLEKWTTRSSTRKKFRQETVSSSHCRCSVTCLRPPTNSSSIPISVRNFLERLLGVSDRQRHQNGARPRRNLIDVEPEPVGKQHDLRRNRRNRVLVVLARGNIDKSW